LPGRWPLHALCAVFFAGGAAALVFEMLWFRQAGLLLGNTVWTSALVTASFMAGLAIGNAAAARRGWRLARPLRAYAALEATVAATGLALVAAIPHLIPLLAPALTAIGSRALLDAARLGAAFLLLAVPSSAMGATLPVLARALAGHEADFGRVLGRLYGWNTLGAVTGALAGEALLIGALGITGAGAVAAALNLTAAGSALLLDRKWPSVTGAPPLAAPPRAARLEAAAFVAGGLLLALEIVWFRFMLLFVAGTSLAFAVMLAMVLVGIALGGLLASAVLRRRPEPHRLASVVALAGGIAVVAGYATFAPVLAALADPPSQWRGTGILSAVLMLPVCLASGVLFVALGKSLHAEVGEEAAAAGRLTLANTLGAMTGALGAGFVLLPILGIERSLFVLAAGYVVVAALVPAPAPRRPRLVLGAWAALAAALALFPFGSMASTYTERVRVRFSGTAPATLAAWKESLTETVFILRYDIAGVPREWRLATNGTSMATTGFHSRRYMGLYAWWPVAVHPGPRRALLISYGLGTTARALVETRELERIDVVDVSADVLALSAITWPEPSADPLRDPRVRTHVEDGRFFLQTARDSYDLITGEPPPPKTAGMVNLYSREYFALMKARLAPGGIVTYWLPVLQMEPRESFGVARAFCDVFGDCSLWTGVGHEWMLAGTAGASGGVSEERFARQWSDPRVGPLLREAGLDSPAHLGATFLADAAALRALTDGVPPVVDGHPYRLDPSDLGPFPSPEYHRLMDTGAARARFRASPLVARLWPARWAEATLPRFDDQAVLNRIAWYQEGVAGAPDAATLERALAPDASRAVALFAFSSSAREQESARAAAAQGATSPELFEIFGIGALVRGEYAAADAYFTRAQPYAGARATLLAEWRALARRLGGAEPSGAAR
jgi:predicted membrane-bound spermidine synthase